MDTPQGGITIWEPTSVNKYGSSNPVQFARPVPGGNQSTKQSSKQDSGQSKKSRASTTQSNIPRIKSLAPSRYGKDHKRNYGK